jgi:hypothetical protein
MHKLTILTLVAIFLTAACITSIQPAKASTEEVATSAVITTQPEKIVPGEPFTVVVQISPHPPSDSDIFYNIFVIVTSAAQGVSGYGPWSAGPSSSKADGVANFTFDASISSTIATTGGGNIEVRFPGQFFGNTTILHYQAGDWQKNFFAAAQTPTPAPTATIPRPSVPEFTAQFVNSSLEVTIKNQPPPLMASVSNASLYYGFRFKNPNSTLAGDWNYAPIFFAGTSSYGKYYQASTSNITTISFPLGDYPFDGENHRTGISRNGPVDMQVMALVGTEVPTDYENGAVYAFYGATSDWSSTQTITAPKSSDSPMPTANTGPHTELFPTLTVLAAALAVAAVVIASIVLFRRYRKTSR